MKELFTHKNNVFQSLDFWSNQKDGVVYNNIHNVEWIEEQLSSLEITMEYVRNNIKMWNPTSIGNLAYLALNAPLDSQKEKCKKIFDNVINYFNDDL